MPPAADALRKSRSITEASRFHLLLADGHCRFTFQNWARYAEADWPVQHVPNGRQEPTGCVIRQGPSVTPGEPRLHLPLPAHVLRASTV